MNIHALFHEPDSNYCYPSGSKQITLRLRTSVNDVFDSVRVIYGDKYTFHLTQKSIEMGKQYQDELFSYYEISINLTDVRFVYLFEITYDEKKYYYCEDGLLETYDFNFSFYNCFQYPYINAIDVPQTVSWMHNSVFYEIFVDRFFKGDDKKDQSYINLKWNDIPNSKSFAGGDLKGIIAKLDYLEELGVNVLYLTPIFSSISNHKYDINDYYKIDPQFGDEEIFQELVQKAHSRGIRIVLDGVFNHTSNLLSQFDDVVKHGRTSSYFDWFIIRGDKVDMKKINYETFSNCYYHPKFNTSNPDVQKFLINIGKYYVEKFDIDGWRLDVADELSHDFWRKFREEIKLIKPDCLLMGENWHNAYPFLHGDQFDSIMNYAFTKSLLDFFAYGKLDAKAMSNKLNSLLVRNSDMVNSMMLNLLDSHDTYRFYTECKKDINKLLEALAITFVFKGTPGLYYGIEIPLEGGYDPNNRRCMDWDKVGVNSEYFEKLKKLIGLRKNSVIQNGKIRIYEQNGLLYIHRYVNNDGIILVINNTNFNIIIEDKMENILSHNYQDNVLKANGFVIRKETL